jgi:hypothetical protein
MNQLELAARARQSSRAAALAGPALALAALVAASAVLRVWLGRGVPTPWIAPDEMIYGLLGRTLYRTGRLAIEGAHSDYYSFLYPALIGGPLAWAAPERGYEIAKAVGAVAMSLAAVPAYLWARSVASTRSALAVAALTLAIPAFSLTGLLMTETLFYPVALAASWAMARVLVAPTGRRQLALIALVASAALVRLQGVVFLLVFATAVLLYGGMRPAFSRYRVALVGFGTLVAAWAAWRLALGGGALGAYSVVASSGYQPGPAARYVVYHVGDLVLITGLLPVGAAALLWFERRQLSSEARATLAVATALGLWLVLEVGIFASRYVGHLAERDLIAAAPPLFLCLLVWLERGTARTLRRSAVVALPALGCVFAWPLLTLLTPTAFPDNPSLMPIFRVAGTSVGYQQLILDGGLAVLALFFAAAPLRLLRLTPALLVLLLGAGSIAAARETAAAAQTTQNVLVGARPDWIDRVAGGGHVVLLYAGARDWPVVWETLFWNQRVERALALPGAHVLGPVPGGAAWIAPDGMISQAGRPVRTRYVVTSSALQIQGTPIATAQEGAGNTTVGNVLWRVQTPLRVFARELGVQANGDIWSSATVETFGCPGTLLLNLLSKEDERINLYRDGLLYRSLRTRPPTVLRLIVPSRPQASGRCSFGITTTGLVGTSLIAFKPRS